MVRRRSFSALAALAVFGVGSPTWLAKVPAANFPVSATPNSPHAANPPSCPKRGVWVPEVARAEAEHYFGGLGMDDWYFRHYTPAGQWLGLPSTPEHCSLLRSFVGASS